MKIAFNKKINSTNFFLFQFLILLLLVSKCSCVFEEISQDIHDFSPCLSTSTLFSSYGCTSSFNGNTGELVIVENKQALHQLVDTLRVKDVIVLLAADLFTKDNVNLLEESVNFMVGLLVANAGPLATKPLPENYLNSPESRYCDSINAESIKRCDEANSTEWNPQGDGLLYRLNSFPIMLLNNANEIESLISCVQNPNQKKSIFVWKEECHVTINSLMYSAQQSALVCNRKNTNPFLDATFCSDMFSKNLFISLSDYKKDFDKNKKSILITAKMDHRSLFYLDQTGGAQSTGLPLAFALTLINLLGQLKKDYTSMLNDTKYNIVFVLFDGEAWDFTGSTRFSYDLQGNSIFYHQDFKQFNKDSIEYIIEIDQLGHLNFDPANQSSIFMHVPQGQQLSSDLIDIFQKYLKLDGFKAELSSLNKLPPSSTAQLVNNIYSNGFKTVLLSDYDTKFNTRFFNSHLDTAEAAGFTFDKDEQLTNKLYKESMEKLIRSVVKSIIALSGKSDDYINKLKISNYTIPFSELLYCITYNADCALYNKLIPEKVSRRQLKSRYFNDGTNPGLFKRIASYYLGEVYPLTSSVCSDEIDTEFYYNFNGADICVRNASVFETYSYINQYLKESRATYPYWTESTYSNTINIKYFYKLPSTTSLITFTLGLFVTFVTLIISAVITKYSGYFFY